MLAEPSSPGQGRSAAAGQAAQRDPGQDGRAAGRRRFPLHVCVAELQQVLARLATHGGERLVTYLRLEEVKPPSPLPLAPTPPVPARARRAR